jgi:signal transduction histidine kinase
MVARLNHRSAMIVPLRVGNRTLGSITFFTADQRRHYDERDLALAEELGRRAALALDRARLYESALVANQAKADFLAVMSHELRTPLTTVMGYTDLLLTGLPEALSNKATEYVQRVRTAAWHLLGLIEQILVYARIEVGREKMHPERLHVGDLMRDVASLIEPVAAERGLTFNVKGPSQPGIVETDLTKIRQILLNLLANAVKFTDQGVVWFEGEHDGGGVLFTVRDTGIGIAPEHL